MKDPAFLFYPNDYIGGTMGMTFEQKGAYIELLMTQFNRGHMTIHMIKKILSESENNIWDVIKSKFVLDEHGLYYNERLEIEQNKRKAYSESRRKNIEGRNQYTKKEEQESGHMTLHMEDRNILSFSLWKEDYKVYIEYLLFEFERIKKDKDWLLMMSKMNPKVDVLKSIEKSIAEYWGQESAWMKKKSDKKTQMINWKSTFAKTMKFHLVPSDQRILPI